MVRHQPERATSPGSGDFLPESGFFISLKSLSSVYISRTASLTRPVRPFDLSKQRFSGKMEPIICHPPFNFVIVIFIAARAH